MTITRDRLVDSARLLLELGADPCACDPDGDTALHVLCWTGGCSEDGSEDCREYNEATRTIIEMLVHAGTPVGAVNARGETALHRAAAGDWGDPVAVETLIRLGAQTDAKDNEGNTPLSLAAAAGELACIRLLLEAGANPRVSNQRGETPAILAHQRLLNCTKACESAPEFRDAAHHEEALTALNECIPEWAKISAQEMERLIEGSLNDDWEKRAYEDAKAALALLTRACAP